MIHHVTRTVRPSELGPCIDFYGILGFRPVQAPAGIARRAQWLQSDGPRPAPQVHLMPAHDARAATGHFAIVCRDYDDTLARLRNAGHEVDRRAEHWGSPRSYVHDPAGNLVELMAWPPGERQGRPE